MQNALPFCYAEEALKHHLWLSDAEAVHVAALGLYDLNLAATITLNSQREPKEFLPFLQELERMPHLLMRYTIDLKLQRFENALKYIISVGDAYCADYTNLTKKYPHVFSPGLLQLIADPSKKKQVLKDMADHLSNEKYFEDAPTNLLLLGFGKGHEGMPCLYNWKGMWPLAGLLKLEKDEVLKLAHELCEELRALGEPAEAAKIALDHCGDANNEISLLINARDWKEALRDGDE